MRTSVTLTLTTCALALATASTAEASQGFHSKFHEKNVGKIMFTSVDNKLDGHDKRKYSSAVKVGQPVYLRAFFADAPAVMLKKEKGVKCIDDRVIFILAKVPGDEKPILLRKMFLGKKQFADWTTVRQNEPLMGGKTPTYWPADLESVRYHFLAGVVARLPKGETTIHLSADAQCFAKGKIARMTVAEGDLTVKVSSAKAVAKVVKKEGPFLRPGKHKQDRKLQPTMKKTASDKWKEDVLLATTLSSDWKVKRHPVSGKAIHRTLDAAVVVSRSEKNAKLADHSCRVFGVSFQQDASGPRKFQDEMSMATGQSAPFPCENKRTR